MNTNRKIAIIVGVLFIIATVAGIISVIFFGSAFKIPVQLATISANENQVIIGALFYFIMAAAIPAIAIAIYPVLKKYNEAWALGYIAARIGEGFFFIVQIVAMLAVLTLSQQSVNNFQSLGNLTLIAGEWASLFGFGFFFTLSALILNYVLYRTNLVPRWLSVWGFIGAVLICVHYILLVFANNQLNILFMPIAAQEMVFALWLIVKGFNPAALESA